PFVRVRLAGQDDLAVGGFEAEVKLLAVFRFLEFKFCCHLALSFGLGFSITNIWVPGTGLQLGMRFPGTERKKFFVTSWVPRPENFFSAPNPCPVRGSRRHSLSSLARTDFLR